MKRSFPEIILCTVLFPITLQAGEEPKVRTVKLEQASAARTFKAPGRTAPVEEATIFARATGTLSGRNADIGDRVKRNDVLAVIDAAEIPHQIHAAEARVEQTEARQELAGLLMARGEKLAESNAFSKESLDERRSGVKTAAADLLSARAELGRLEEIRRFLTIRAPFDGTITARRVDRGDQINGDPSSGDAWLFRIARLDELRMVLHVPPATALQIGTGEEAEVSFPDVPGKIFPAEVARSSGVVEADSGTMRVELRLPNADLILPAGLSGVAVIKSKSQAPVMMVPSNAVTVRGGVPHVALVEGDKVRFRAVRPGRTIGSKIEIFSDLSAESDVILSPNALLQEGDDVEVTEAGEGKKTS